jgi:hypothetical protein
MATLLFFYPLKFKMPAYWLLPLWLVAELFLRICAWPVLSCSSLGACGRFSLRNVRCECRAALWPGAKANEAIESELGWMSNPDIVGASDAMDQGRLDEAAAALQKHLTANAPSSDALNLLQLVQRRRQDMPACLQATSGLGSEYQAAEEASKPLATGTLK